MSSKYRQYKGAPPLSGLGRAAPDTLPPTPPDILGLFYRPGSPWRTNFVDQQEVDPATKMTLTGRVFDTTGCPAFGALVEFWQADPAGKYDESGPGFRGIQAVGCEGEYRLETARPGDYDISAPGAPEPHEFRCPHIHVKVWVGRKNVLTTQLYFPGAEHNETDHWFDPRRVIRFTDKTNATFDLVVKV